MENYVLYETPGKQLWLSISGKGMHRWDKQSKSFQLFFPYQEKVNAIIPDQTDSCYWLATWDHSLIRFNPKADNIKESFIHQPLPVNSIGQTATTAIDVVRDDIYGYFGLPHGAICSFLKKNRWQSATNKHDFFPSI